MVTFIGILLSQNEEILDEIREVKRRVANLNENVNELRDAVAGVAERVANLSAPLNDALENVKAELDAERAKYADLVTAEDAEDVQQNSALDAALVDANDAAAGIQDAVDKLNDLAVAPEEADDDEPAEPAAPADDAPVVPVDPAPADDAPVVPADDDADVPAADEPDVTPEPAVDPVASVTEDPEDDDAAPSVLP